MESIGEDAADRLVEDELESAIDRAMAPARAPAARAPLRSLATEVKRLSGEEMARVQALAGADEWFLEGDGHPVGPITTAQMKERWLAHGVGPESRCWGIGLLGWTPLCRITALARALGPQLAYPIHSPRPPPLVPDEALPPPVDAPKAAPPAHYTRPTRPRPVLLEGQAPPAPPEPGSQPRRPFPQESSEDLPAPLHGPVRPAPGVGSSRVFPLPEHLARDVVPGRTHPQRPPEDLPGEAPPVSRSAHQALSALVGAVIGLSAVAILIALVALPPLLSPPKPKTPPAEAAATAPSAPAPAPDPGAAKQPAPERPAKKSAPPASPEPAAGPAPVPTADPETEAAFDRAFGPPEAPRPVPKLRARLSDADVMAVVVAHKGQMVKCRNEARAKDPELAGQLLMRWTVSLDGEPEDVESLPSDLRDTDLATCVAGAVRGWSFPRHAAEQPPITFPFVF